MRKKLRTLLYIPLAIAIFVVFLYWRGTQEEARVIQDFITGLEKAMNELEAERKNKWN